MEKQGHLRPISCGHATAAGMHEDPVKRIDMNKLQVERLAYWLWQQRGKPSGSPDEDWFLAEQLLKRRYKLFELSMREMPLFASGMEKRTW
jgi:hypothetical protein